MRLRRSRTLLRPTHSLGSLEVGRRRRNIRVLHVPVQSAYKRKQMPNYTVCHAPGSKGAAPSDALAVAEQAASDASAAAPKGLGEAASAAKEAAAGAAESVKDAAPSNPFAGLFGGKATALGFHMLTSSCSVPASASDCSDGLP